MSALGTLNINVFATGKLTAASARRGYFPKVLLESESTEIIQEDYFASRYSRLNFGNGFEYAIWQAKAICRRIFQGSDL